MKTLASPSLPAFTRRRVELPTIDQVMVEERAAAFAKRSIKTGPNSPG